MRASFRELEIIAALHNAGVWITAVDLAVAMCVRHSMIHTRLSRLASYGQIEREMTLVKVRPDHPRVRVARYRATEVHPGHA